MPIAALLALLMAPQDFNPGGDSDRSIGERRVKLTKLLPDPVPLLGSYGDEAIRFTSEPEIIAGARTFITLIPDKQGIAHAVVTTSGLHCPANRKAKCSFGSTQGPGFSFCLDGDCSYRGVAAQIRALVFDPARMPSASNPDRTVCFDGPGYLTEFREGGRTYNLSGFCAMNHPNRAIEALVRKGAGDRWQVPSR